VTDTGKTVAVCIVTHNSAADLPRCLESVGRLEYRPLEVVLVDCASRDNSSAVARQQAPYGLDVELVALDRNLGFAGGMNVALQATNAPWVLTLNPDAFPDPEFVSRLVECVETHPELPIGAVTGRLLRPAGDGPRHIDACGMYLTPTWRHLDRGSGAEDRGQWSSPERVFGATAAASLLSREALEDVAVEGEFFAAEFHTYREDAELCFRLRERDWEVIYEPRAICDHRRSNLPDRRHTMSREVNYHSLKNRYLLRAYHQYPANLLLTLLPTIWRDLLAFAYVIAAERSSLAAYSWLWNHRRSIRHRRRLLASRRTAKAQEINRWFRQRSLPL